MQQTRWSFLSDRQFWLAVIAAPVVWAVWLAVIAAPVVWAVMTLFIETTSQQNFDPIIVIFLYPILEELAFRGGIQGWLSDKMHNVILGLSSANILTSFLFMGLHFFYHPPLWAISIFIPSLIFGYFKDRTGWVLPSILLHIFYNAGYFYLF